MVDCRELSNDRTRSLLDPAVQLAGFVKGCERKRVAIDLLVADHCRAHHAIRDVGVEGGQPKGELLVVRSSSIRQSLLRLYICGVDEGQEHGLVDGSEGFQ